MIKRIRIKRTFSCKRDAVKTLELLPRVPPRTAYGCSRTVMPVSTVHSKLWPGSQKNSSAWPSEAALSGGRRHRPGTLRALRAPGVVRRPSQRTAWQPERRAATGAEATGGAARAVDRGGLYDETPFLSILKNSSSLMYPFLSRSAAVIISSISSSVIVSPSSRATACRLAQEMRPAWSRSN